MLSQVPILDGTNYQQWSVMMKNFLMSQNQWRCAKEGAAPPTIGTTEYTDEDGSKRTETTGESAYESWIEDAEKALGNMRLRINYNIGYQFNAIETPVALWKELHDRYGTPGVNRAYTEFKLMMDTVIPNGSDPGPALDKILAHFATLKEMKWVIPDNILAMMILSRAPSNYESMVQLLTTTMESDAKKMRSLEPGVIVSALRQAWDTQSRLGAQRGNQQRANKLSAVKPFQNQPPSFQQQQQQPQRGEWEGGRGNGRGG